MIIPLEEISCTKTKIKWKCSCGNIFLSTSRSYESGCSECKSKRMKLLKAKSIDYYIDKIPKNFVLVEKMDTNTVNQHTKVKIRCLECDNLIETTFNNIRRIKNLCLKCKLNTEKQNFINRIPTKVKLLGEYINNVTKTEFLCECGNIWKTSPRSILKGSLCGCGIKSNALTEEEKCRRKEEKLNKQNAKNKEKKLKILNAINTINEKGYKVKEEMKNLYTQINVKCICGNVWKVSPRNIINNNVRCGCNSTWRGRTSYKDRRTIIYFIKVDNYYKIGLTIPRNKKNTFSDEEIIKMRYGKKYEGFNIKLIKYKIYEDGSEAWDKEKSILRKFKEFKVITDEYKNTFGGYSEMFYYNIEKLSIFEL